ncbi:MAG: 1,4-alpha-glucan branching protein GlgB [Verrucomicrobiae bacterium]|nr:1,4-alpha-glucan branching protein GlgB [Verrucomicrobiae bacterium]
MILTQEEIQSLVEARQNEPHRLLGMHPLGEGQGLVVRALLPYAAEVSVEPAVEKGKPGFALTRLDAAGLFEGITTGTDTIYAYDLVIKDHAGNEHRTRDAYSFLPTLGEADLHLFGEGNERRIYDKLGSHPRTIDGVAGVSFAVWAPGAQRASVIGDFNGWDGRFHPMRRLGSSGIWEIFVPGLGIGTHYKFELRTDRGDLVVKTDPYGFYFEVAPKSAAIVWETHAFEWTDEAWLEARKTTDWLTQPLSVYEVHLGSWMKKNEAESFSYREVAPKLVEYVTRLGFTHVEFLPLAEHAYYPSWGYQVTGFFAPTQRYGTPEDFQFMVNALHEANIGVIIDWVPAHFPRDEWALARFDGTALYEHEDPRQGSHQDWGTLIFNYGRHEVRNFLTSNALYWCERFHIDGLRVDAVASMLYLDYSRNEGEWVPNKYGGRENLEAIDFLREFNHLVHTEHPGVMTIAEESTAWPQVTRPPYIGGLGFSFKWNMGWMHDTLDYFKRDPIYRQYHQNDLTFAMLYHYNENFMLPLSHDEVVHGKCSLLGRMPGDDWQRFANLRALYGYQWLFPGKMLTFMGCEFGQAKEWSENRGLDWWLLEMGPFHLGLQRFVSDLNRVYREHAALWEADFDPAGFYWVDCSDHSQSVLSFVRQTADRESRLIVIMHLTPSLLPNYRVGVPGAGRWAEVLNSDAEIYGGSNSGNLGGVNADAIAMHGQDHSIEIVLPPLSIVAFRSDGNQ